VTRRTNNTSIDHASAVVTRALSPLTVEQRKTAIAAVRVILGKRQRKPRLKAADDELQIVSDLAKRLEPQLRKPYLQAVTLALRRYKPEQLGPGLIARIARDLLREFMRP
jgi:hypothetical protein